MTNPWLNIDPADYEDHMSDKDVKQLQALNLLTKQFLDKYKPQSFALLGCTTGNGLEHINTGITKQIHAIDINPDYLKITAERYAHIPNLKTHLLDINTDDLHLNDIDLFLLPLVLEYVDIDTAIRKVAASMSHGGNIAIVIQSSDKADFVSKTAYSSLNALSDIASIVDEKALCNILSNHDFSLSYREVMPLKHGKSFIVLEFSNIK